jgi:hypothetical protein
LDPIEDLRETLLPKPIENTIGEQKDEDSDEESFEALKENIEEDNEFCEQLLEHCHNKDFLVKFCMQRREEYNTILQNYEREPTRDIAWEVSIAYYGVKSLCDTVTKKYSYQEILPTQDRSFLMPKEVSKLIEDQAHDDEYFLEEQVHKERTKKKKRKPLMIISLISKDVRCLKRSLKKVLLIC